MILMICLSYIEGVEQYITEAVKVMEVNNFRNGLKRLYPQFINIFQ